jgi:hypothetical protein
MTPRLRSTLTYVVLIATFLRAGVSLADKSNDARQLFQEANAHFAVGEFNDAGEKYLQAYKLKQDPALLYNAAQSFRLGGNNARALVLYKNLLQFYPKAARADEVRGQIIKLTEAIAAADKAKNSPPTATFEHATTGQTGTPTTTEPPPTTTPPVTGQTTTPPPATTTESQPQTATATTATRHDKPIYKKWWFWTAVGGVVVVAVVAGAVGGTVGASKWQTAADIGPGATHASLRGPAIQVQW